MELEDNDDPIDKLLNKTGCIGLHHKVQECIAEKKDWRKCQEEVKKFRVCMDSYNKKRKDSLK